MEGSGTGSGSVQKVTDPDPGGLKTYGSYGSRSGTLLKVFKKMFTYIKHNPQIKNAKPYY
jgi:hypothetical protein